MLVLFHLRTEEVGADEDTVYRIDEDVDDAGLDDIAYELARDNAEMYGVEDDEQFSGWWEKLHISEEEAEELYGEIQNI